MIPILKGVVFKEINQKLKIFGHSFESLFYVIPTLKGGIFKEINQKLYKENN